MAPKNGRRIGTSFALGDMPFVPGLSLRPAVVGRLVSLEGVHFELGGYTCLHFVESGSGLVCCAGQEQKVGPGDLFCIMEDNEIAYRDDPKDPWTYLYVLLDGPGADDFVRALGFSPNEPWRSASDAQGTQMAFDRLMDSAQHSNPGAHALAAAVLELGALLAPTTPEPSAPHRHRRLIDRAEVVVAAQLHTRLNVTELAAALRVDRTTLFHAFRSELNCSPVAYLRNKRIERAKKYLADGNERSLIEIAHLCGFANEKYFSKTFRMLTGQTPRAYSPEN